MAAITKQKILLWSGYTGFFLFCFAVFAYLTFPYERVRDLLISKVQAANGPGVPETKLSIGELGPSWLTGVALTSVTLQRGSGTPGDSPTRLSADEIKLRLSPFKLLLGGLGLHFAASAGEGEIAGSYDQPKSGPVQLQAELDALDLARVGIGSLLGLPLGGAASGSVELTLAEKPSQTQGDIDLRIEGFKLGDKKAAKLKLPGMSGPLTLDPIDAGTLVVKIKVHDGLATIEHLESKGKDVELSGLGTIRLAQHLAQARADLTLSAKFAQAYRQKNDRTKAMFDILSAQRAVGADGALRVKIGGLLGNLHAAPVPSAINTSRLRRGPLR